MKQLGSVVTDFSKGYVCLKFNVEKSCFLPQFFVVARYSAQYFSLLATLFIPNILLKLRL